MDLQFPKASKGGLLGLDLAKKTGWAYAVPGELPVGDTWKLPGLQDDVGAQGKALETALRQAIDFYRPEWIYGEAAIMVRGQQQVASMKTGFGLWAIAAKVAYEDSIKFREMTPQAARMRVLRDQYPQPPKRVVMRFCQERGWTFYDDNEADAHIVREAGMLNVWNRGALCPAGAWDGVRFWRNELV